MQVVANQKTVFPGVVSAALFGALIMSLAPVSFSSIISVESADRAAEPIAAYTAPAPLASIELSLDRQRIQQELDGIDQLLPRARLKPAAEGRMIAEQSRAGTVAITAEAAIATEATEATIKRELDAYEEVRDHRHELVRLAELHVEQRRASRRTARSSLRASAPLSFPDHALAAGGQGLSAASPRSMALDLADDSRGIAGGLRPIRSIAVPACALRSAVFAENTVDRDYHQLRNGYAGGYDSIVSEPAVVLSSAPVLAATIHDSQSFAIVLNRRIRNSLSASVSVFGRTQPRLALRTLLVFSKASSRGGRALSFGEMI